MSGLVQEMWMLRNNRDQFHLTFLFQLKKELSSDEVRKLVMWVALAVVAWSIRVLV
jgi:hypothetical protein